MTMSTQKTQLPRSSLKVHLAHAGPLLAVLALAVALRLIFVTGVVFSDDLGYAQAAHGLSRGVFPTELGHKQIRIGLYAPVALLYALFGVSDATTLAWPFLCSLLGIIFIYFIACLQLDETAGLIAAFLWAVFPLDILLATSLLPDAPLAAFSSGVILFFLLAERWQGRRAYVAYAASLLCLVFALSIKLSGILVVVFFSVYLVWKRRPERRLWFFFLIVVFLTGAFAIGYFLIGGRGQPDTYFLENYGSNALPDKIALSATDWFQVITQSSEFYATAPLLLVAIVALLAARRREATVPLIWLGSMFLYFELGTQSPLSYNPIIPFMPRHILFVMAPFVVITGIYLAQGLSLLAARGLVVGAALVTVSTAWVGSQGAPALPDWMLGQEAITRPFAVLSALSAAVVIFGGVASPALVLGSPARWKCIIIGVLLSGVGLASLNPAYEGSVKYRMPGVENTQQAVRFLRTQPDYPWLAQNTLVAVRINYESGFRLDFDGFNSEAVNTNTKLSVATEDIGQVVDAYVIVDEWVSNMQFGGETPAYLDHPPSTWAEIARFGEIAGHQMVIYRMLTSEAAANEYQTARAAVEALPSEANLHWLVEAAVNSDKPCEALTAWWRLRAIGANMADWDPVPTLSVCYARQPETAGLNLLQNGDFAQGLDGWYRVPTSQAALEVVTDAEVITPTLSITTARPEDGVLLLQGITLQPDTAYVFEATVKSTVPAVWLYWEADVGRYFHEDTHPDWEQLRYVFITPHWDEQARNADFHPVVVRGAGQVWLQGVRLSELGVKANGDR